MSSNASDRPSGPREASDPTEADLRDLLEFLIQRSIEDRLRAGIEDHCRRPLRRIEERLHRLDQAARKVLNHAR